MTTIFSQVRDWLIDLLVDAGVPRAEIREDLAQDRDGPIAWDVVVSLCARYERVLPDREGRIAAVRRAASARFRRVASAPSGGFVDQRQFYWSAQHWLLPALLPTLTTEAHELPDGRVSCTVESPADATACPVLFELIGGAVMAVPHLFGHPKTPVEVEICDRCGVYIMKPPSPDDNVAPTENRAAPEEWRERFESILRGSGQIVYDWDTRTGTVEIHGEHDSLEIHIGPTKNRLRDFLLHMSDADRARFRAELRRAMKAKDRFYFEISIPQPGSEPIAVEHEGYFILDTAGEIRRMVGFARNVTDRKRGEKARRDHQRVLDRVAGSSPEILYLFDAQAYRFIYLNDAIEATLGLTAADVTGRGGEFVERRIHPDDRQGFADYSNRIAQVSGSEVVERECRFRHENGEWRWLRLRSRVLSRTSDREIAELLGTATDITAYTRAQEALRISEERYRIVSELTSDYHFSVRVDADGTMEREWISEAFNRITGYEPDELSEAQWEQLVHPDDHAIRREQFVTAINTGSLIHEYRILRKSGELRWIREHARVIRDEDGSLHWYGACQDITERKLAENERALTQERFDAITRSSRDIITEIDASGRALYVSPNVAEITGFPPEHFTAERRSEVVHPEDQKVVTERITKMMSTGESEALVYRMRNREGAWRWMDATATAFHTSNGEIRAVMISRDISDRLEMEDERRRLSSVVENSSELIAMMDADGRLLFLNDAGRELVGVRETDRIRDLTIFDFLCAEDAQDMRFTVVPTAQQSHHWEGDFQLRHRMSGAHIATLAHVFLVATQRHEGGEVLAIVARDISERIRSEKLLRESEARHRLLVESAYDLIAEFDSDGRFAYVSPNFQRQLGYSPDELLEGFWLDVVHPEDRESARVAVAEAVASVTREWPPLRLRHRDGGWRWVEINLKQYESISGEELLLAFFRDITRRKLAEEALRQSQEQLLHAQKMEAIGRLAGGVAHDFNNLLTAITGYGDLLLEEIGDAEPLRNDAEEIIRAAERAAGLTRQLLAFSRRQVLAPKVLDLNSLVADVESLLRRLIGEDIDLSTRLDAHRPWVRLDPGQLEQLVMNLSVNARDAMPQGGRLEIATANLSVRDDDGRTHPGVAPADYVTLTVQDTGEGMRPQIVSKIFEPFFTTKEVNKGTGLGLATVYGIIRQSGGEIRVESRPGEGSTFTVYLPQVDEEPMAPAPLESGDELRGHETILLVEDSDTVRNLMRRYFEKQGYTVLAAASGTDALQVAASHGDPIDLLVTDVVLPRMDGHELSQLLKRLQPDLEVLFVSGFSEDTLSRHGVVASDIDLIQKPFSPPTLLRAARRVLSGASHGDRP